MLSLLSGYSSSQAHIESEVYFNFKVLREPEDAGFKGWIPEKLVHE